MKINQADHQAAVEKFRLSEQDGKNLVNHQAGNYDHIIRRRRDRPVGLPGAGKNVAESL